MPRRLKPVKTDRATLERAVLAAEDRVRDFTKRAHRATSMANRWRRRRDALVERLRKLPPAAPPPPPPAPPAPPRLGKLRSINLRG